MTKAFGEYLNLAITAQSNALNSEPRDVEGNGCHG